MKTAARRKAYFPSGGAPDKGFEQRSRPVPLHGKEQQKDRRARISRIHPPHVIEQVGEDRPDRRTEITANEYHIMNTRPPRTEAVSEATESAIVVSDVPVSWMPINARSHKGRGGSMRRARTRPPRTPARQPSWIADRSGDRTIRRSPEPATAPTPSGWLAGHPRALPAPTTTPPSRVTLLPKWIRMSSLSVEAYRP